MAESWTKFASPHVAPDLNHRWDSIKTSLQSVGNDRQEANKQKIMDVWRTMDSLREVVSLAECYICSNKDIKWRISYRLFKKLLDTKTAAQSGDLQTVFAFKPAHDCIYEGGSIIQTKLFW